MWYGHPIRNSNFLDKYIFETYLKDIKNGVFIEAGAFDGFTQSNTRALEQRYGWNGVLVEPSPDMYKQCVKTRNANVYNCALVPSNYNEKYVEGDFSSNLAKSSINGSRMGVLNLVKVPARTLQSCLDDCNINHVDFFSLDVEGFELEVLNGIDWTKTSFSYLLIEFNPSNIEILVTFMNNKGYDFIENVSKFSKVTHPLWDGQHNDYLFKKGSKIIDCFTFYNELDMLKFRLEYLYDTVDHFVLVEATRTHAGNPKSLYFQDNKHLFQPYLDKIVHVVVEDMPDGNDPWVRERFQRNAIRRGTSNIKLNDNDKIIISDLDEIPDRNTIKSLGFIKEGIHALCQDLYYYNLNTRVDVIWKHPKIVNYRTYLLYSPDSVRMGHIDYEINKGGWHLSYFGNAQFIRNKIQNYAHQEHNLDEYKETIDTRIKNKVDIFDRPYVHMVSPNRSYLPEGHETICMPPL